MQKKARVGSGNSMRYLHCHFYRVDFNRVYKAAQLRGLFRFAGCGSPLLILLVAGPWPATVEENPGKGRNNGI